MKKLALLILVLFAAFGYADTKAVWNAPTDNTDGSPLTDLSHYILAIAKQAEDLNSVSYTVEVVSRVDCLDPQCEQLLTDMLSSLPRDTYKAWVCAVDTSGNSSVWAGTQAGFVGGGAPPDPDPEPEPDPPTDTVAPSAPPRIWVVTVDP